MKSIKVLNRKFVTKGGKEFYSATIKGKYVPLATANLETYYSVKLVDGGEKLPSKEGIFEIAFEERGCWIDQRPEFAEKNILRVKAVRIVKDGNLPSKHKEVEETPF